MILYLYDGVAVVKQYIDVEKKNIQRNLLWEGNTEEGSFLRVR